MGLSDSERLDRLRLIRSEHVGPATFRQLLERYPNAGDALVALPDIAARGGLRRRPRICGREDAEAELEAATRLGAVLIADGDSDFPAALARTDGAPPLIYARGRTGILNDHAIAIVGSRNCSASGMRLTRKITSDLGAEGLVIASGLARGIDGAAHAASLETGTVAALAGGFGHFYPPEHAGLADAITENGCLVTEMPPDWKARGRDFPRRNRIIAGLSRGVIVVEAAARSGSLITSRLALEQGREVFAVPGSPLDPRAEGTNRLIRDGATLTRSAQDVLEALRPGLHQPELPRFVSEAPAEAVEPTDADTSRIAGLLGPSPVEIDELIRQSGLQAGTVHVVLLEMSHAGRLERHPGQRVSLA